MNYLLDTNIFVIYGRKNELANKIEQDLQLFTGKHNLGVSVVTLGELDALAKQLNYGKNRLNQIQHLLTEVFKIKVGSKKIIERYGDIDAFSQGKFKIKPSNFSSRNMGKNDLWIAATASVFDMILVTTDKDFYHLNKTFLKVKYIDLEKYK